MVEVRNSKTYAFSKMPDKHVFICTSHEESDSSISIHNNDLDEMVRLQINVPQAENLIDNLHRAIGRIKQKGGELPF